MEKPEIDFKEIDAIDSEITLSKDTNKYSRLGKEYERLTHMVKEVFSNKYINEKVKLILDDPIFIDKVETSIKSIIKDNKVEQTDIPKFVFLIMEAYNSLPKAKLTKKEIPEFISCVYNYLVEKYNFIPNEEKNKYESLVASSIKLVLMTPQLKIPKNNKFHCLIC
jgi:hypothetical protein